jgi:hypothetical protein
VAVVEREPIVVTPNPDNLRYLTTKRVRMDHLLADPAAGFVELDTPGA